MDLLTKTIARYIFAVPFAIFGLMHLMNGGAMAGMVPSFIPGGVLWVYLTGIALIAASVSIIMQKMEKMAALLLGVLLIIFVLTIHLPMVMNPDTMQMGMPNMLKDLSLAGAAFFFSGLAKN